MSFDSNTGDYKILRILEDRKQGRKERGEILALKSCSWRKIDEHPGVVQYILLVYGEIPLPENIRMSYTDIGLSELEGMLCAYSNIHHQGKNTFKLRVMKDYGV
ncbi:hypothetical protein CQW23_30492 [Capsicum baccatum]|uniref:Uncharacterized protein n=1 Tax=Capsicum baccatum TaxID=33114 RepID=A0A2G2VAB2_CAPBA|nr:hypothetical protein CQW23_30492 [Capsicum baccatum]